MQTGSDLDRARAAVAAADWHRALELLEAVDASLRSPADLDALADAMWWTGRLDDSVAVRRSAYAGHARAGDADAAGTSAWMLFYELRLAGSEAVARGWLRRAEHHLADQGPCRGRCLLAWTEADDALDRGDLVAAGAAARRMTDLARDCGSRELEMCGVHAQGMVLLAGGRPTEGLALVDEALCAVLAGELDAMFTGWLYCLGLQTCMAAAELRRAVEWTGAAMAWCESLPTAGPFLGLCRIHRVEVLSLHGSWAEAEAQAHRATEELLATYPGAAGAAAYLTGELRRRRGDADGAADAYARAHAMGRDPQPGLALLRLAQGRTGSAAAALRVALGADGGAERLHRSRLLAAAVEVALAGGATDEALAACAELESAAAESGAEVVLATAARARGAVALAAGEHEQALAALRSALDGWQHLALPYETAQTRMLLAATRRALGDHDGAHLELAAARDVFERLGARPDARRAADLLADHGQAAPGRLTAREVQVLRRVAAGDTNREIAARLVISEHTVARHINHIYAKLEVGSRASATAFAYTHELV